MNEEYVRKAIKALGINVPVMRYKFADDGDLILYLYGGRVERWREGDPATNPPEDRIEVETSTTNPPDKVTPSPISPPSHLTPDPSPKKRGEKDGGGGDDFTTIPGVGETTAQKLHDAGVFTFAMLRQAWPVWLKKQISRKISAKVSESIDLYLEEEKR